MFHLFIGASSDHIESAAPIKIVGIRIRDLHGRLQTRTSSEEVDHHPLPALLMIIVGKRTRIAARAFRKSHRSPKRIRAEDDCRRSVTVSLACPCAAAVHIACVLPSHGRKLSHMDHFAFAFPHRLRDSIQCLARAVDDRSFRDHS